MFAALCAVQTVKEMGVQYDVTQATQAPAGTVQSGVFTAQGQSSPSTSSKKE